MKPVVTRLYAVLVVLTLVGLAAWAGADWYQLRQTALRQGQTTLRQAAGQVSDLTLRPGALDSKALTGVFQKTGADPRWKTLVLSSPERGTEFYRGPRPTVAVDVAVPHWAPRDFAEVMISLPVFRAAGDPLLLEGIYEFYGRAEIFSLLKACGMTLVGLLVLTTALVLLGAARKPEAPASAPEEEVAVTDEAPEAELDLGPLPDLETTEEDYWFDDELTMEELPPLEAPAEVAAAAPAPEAAAPRAPSLFSPATGLGWTEFLDVRLAQELDRATGQNQDLALVLLGWKDGSPEPALWGQLVREAFPSIDLDFEQAGGAAVVLPGRTLEQALRSARAFVEVADRALGPDRVFAGVAARAGRLVSASVLVGEADSARRRSARGTARVLGLKTDADRWREHLASESA